MSATYNVDKAPLDASNAIPLGKLKTALVPQPSPSPEEPVNEPLIVVTAKVASEIRRKRLLLASAINKNASFGLSAMPTGLLNEAEVPTPSAHLATPLPASVVVTRVSKFTWRIR
jgi:hypothetical protein